MFTPNADQRYTQYQKDLAEQTNEFEFYPLFNNGRYGVQVEALWSEVFEKLLSESGGESRPTLVDYGSGFCLSGMHLKECLEYTLPDTNP